MFQLKGSFKPWHILWAITSYVVIFYYTGIDTDQVITLCLKIILQPLRQVLDKRFAPLSTKSVSKWCQIL